MATTDTTATGTRALMRAELEQLRAPLRRLQRLSFCLGDEKGDLQVREHLANMLWRRAVLERDLSDRPVTFMSGEDLRDMGELDLDLEHRGHT